MAKSNVDSNVDRPESVENESDADSTPTVEVATLAPEDEVFHRVQPGESWETIAADHDTTPEALHALNGNNPHFSDRSVTVNHSVRVR